MRARPGHPRWATPDGPGRVRRVIAVSPKATRLRLRPGLLGAEYAATMAQLGPEIKNKISHRARALAAFKTLLQSWLRSNNLAAPAVL